MKQGPFPLWPAGQTPGSLGNNDVDIPTITVYSPTGLANNGAAILICPGGGYSHLAPHEGEPVALWANTLGATGIVLKYRLGPRYHHPAMWNDVSRAVRTVRARAGEWKLDPQRVAVLGFSAGGHLASTIATHFDQGNPAAVDLIERQPSRPDLSILVYPVIFMEGKYAHVGSRMNLLGANPDPRLVADLSNDKAVTPQTPPTFLVQSAADKTVPVANSLEYALALEDAGVPFAMQIYEKGGHGFGLGSPHSPETLAWPGACAFWMKQRGFLR